MRRSWGSSHYGEEELWPLLGLLLSQQVNELNSPGGPVPLLVFQRNFDTINQPLSASSEHLTGSVPQRASPQALSQAHCFSLLIMWFQHSRTEMTPASTGNQFHFEVETTENGGKIPLSGRKEVQQCGVIEPDRRRGQESSGYRQAAAQLSSAKPSPVLLLRVHLCGVPLLHQCAVNCC